MSVTPGRISITAANAVLLNANKIETMSPLQSLLMSEVTIVPCLYFL